MIYLDLALRSGAITLLLLLAALMWRAPIGVEGRMTVTALALAKSSFLIITTALPITLHPAAQHVFVLLASLSPAAITWLIVTIFLDAPGRRLPWMGAALATSLALYTHLSVPGSFPICLPLAITLYGALFGLSLWSTRDDLVECRCRARPGFAAAIAGMALIVTFGQFSGLFPANSIQLALVQAGGVFVVTLAFAVWLLNPDADRWPGETAAETQVSTPDANAYDDPALISRIQTAMNAGIWREEGLTIGALATQLAVPEHRLRRAINRGLGYRNFSNFINKARIGAACAALTDPNQMNVTVLEIAYDVGFASVGPFNRAFRAEMGHSPTEHRHLAQTGGRAVSVKSTPIPANVH